MEKSAMQLVSTIEDKPVCHIRLLFFFLLNQEAPGGKKVFSLSNCRLLLL